MRVPCVFEMNNIRFEFEMRKWTWKFLIKVWFKDGQGKKSKRKMSMLMAMPCHYTAHVRSTSEFVPDSSSAFSAILVHVTSPGGRVVIVGFGVVGLFAVVVDDGVVRLDAGSVDDAGVVDAGFLDALVVDEGGIDWSGVVLLSAK